MGCSQPFSLIEYQWSAKTTLIPNVISNKDQTLIGSRVDSVFFKNKFEDSDMDGIVGAVTRLQVLGAICDEKSQVLFNAIARAGNDNNLKEQLKISRKRYYTRLKKLVNADLVKRINGKYNLTELGIVIYGLQLKLSEAIDNRLNLKTLDTMNSSMGIQAGKQNKILGNLNTDVNQDMSMLQEQAEIVLVSQAK